MLMLIGHTPLQASFVLHVCCLLLSSVFFLNCISSFSHIHSCKRTKHITLTGSHAVRRQSIGGFPIKKRHNEDMWHEHVYTIVGMFCRLLKGSRSNFYTRVHQPICAWITIIQTWCSHLRHGRHILIWTTPKCILVWAEERSLACLNLFGSCGFGLPGFACGRTRPVECRAFIDFIHPSKIGVARHINTIIFTLLLLRPDCWYTAVVITNEYNSIQRLSDEVEEGFVCDIGQIPTWIQRRAVTAAALMPKDKWNWINRGVGLSLCRCRSPDTTGRRSSQTAALIEMTHSDLWTPQSCSSNKSMGRKQAGPSIAQDWDMWREKLYLRRRNVK